MPDKIYMLIGFLASKLIALSNRYKQRMAIKRLGGGNRSISSPFIISGIDNIITDEHISIGPGATIYTTRAKLRIKSHFVSGPNLTIITGDHAYILGRFLDSVKDADKDLLPNSKDYDRDVTIDEDVWCGTNVTILKGVHIGRGAIISAGALVINDVPPYSIVGGVPAKVLKYKWTIPEILRHEKKLYPVTDRLTEDYLSTFVN